MYVVWNEIFNSHPTPPRQPVIERALLSISLTILYLRKQLSAGRSSVYLKLGHGKELYKLYYF